MRLSTSRLKGPSSERVRAVRQQTLNEALTDFVGDLPCLTLIVARALSLCLEPVTRLRTVSVCLNGARWSVFTVLPSIENTTLVTLTFLAPFLVDFLKLRVAVKEVPTGTHELGDDSLIVPPGTVTVWVTAAAAESLIRMDVDAVALLPAKSLKVTVTV